MKEPKTENDGLREPETKPNTTNRFQLIPISIQFFN